MIAPSVGAEICRGYGKSFVCSASAVYRAAAADDCQALVQLAGILAHERWHVTHGLDEVGAYSAQLSIMEYLHANTMHLAAARRGLQQVTREVQRQSGRK